MWALVAHINAQESNMLWIVGERRDAHIVALKRAADDASVSNMVISPTDGAVSEYLRPVVRPKVILWRLKRQSDKFVRSHSSAIAQFSELEWRETLIGACEIAECPILNDAFSINRAGCKLRQLDIAAKLGLTTPRYIITNNVAEAKTFVSDLLPGSVLKKPLAVTHIPDLDDITKTNFLSPSIVEIGDILSASEESISSTPILLQEYVKKAYELRIIIIGIKCISFKIDSQLSESTSLDWRCDIFRDMYSFTNISVDFENKLRNFLKASNLFSGVFDAIVTPAGEEVFLECNPNGQWLWLDYLAPGLIASSFIESAIRQVTDRAPNRATPEHPAFC